MFNCMNVPSLTKVTKVFKAATKSIYFLVISVSYFLIPVKFHTATNMFNSADNRHITNLMCVFRNISTQELKVVDIQGAYIS